MKRIVIVCAAFLLDLLLGDPQFLWHPVRGIGAAIAHTEHCLRKVLHIDPEREADQRKKRWAGVLLVICVLFLSVGAAAAVLRLAGRIHPLLGAAVECILCYRMLAMKSLRTESMKVYAALEKDDVREARFAVSMIVGRDTANLDKEGIEKAAIETIAENTSDGVIAPLLYMMLFGALGGVFYKAVNTMDSMVGYKNDAYLYLGWAAAKLDDLLNFIPSRIAAIFMIAASFLLGYNGRNAAYIYRRDRFRHASPNSAQTEAVCAGALQIELAGDAWYFGTLYHKPTIGDAVRSVEAEDIRRANRLLYATSMLTLAVGTGAAALFALLSAAAVPGR
ncbi:MAG: cobalamin biosynthesis protein CobD [Lachnospiraceae bacterium]|nr:cobalamin biosynthesis protein CobD [Lachnospiraceae bacterium]